MSKQDRISQSAVMAELVDALDSGSSRETGGCSSHLDRINYAKANSKFLFREAPLLPLEYTNLSIG